METKVKFPIGVKLSLIISFVLILSLSVITALVSVLVSADVRLTAENNNWTMNRWSTTTAETMLSAFRAKALLLIRNMDIIAQGGSVFSYIETPAELTNRFYRQNPDISCVAFIGQGSTGGVFMNTHFMNADEGERFSRSQISNWLEQEKDALWRAAAGETVLFNGHPLFGAPFIVMLFPLSAERGFTLAGAGAVFFSSVPLEKALLHGDLEDRGNRSFLVNGKGDILIHWNAELARSGVSARNLAIVSQGLESNTANFQTLYTDERGRSTFGAFQRLDGLNAMVVTDIDSELVYAGVRSAVMRIIFAALLVISISVFFIFSFSRIISRPIKKLIAAAETIEKGGYRLQLEATSRDELGVLTGSFIAMANGLANFEKFTNKRIVTLARQGKLGRSGEKRTVTVCFAMIRDFPLVSQGMPPERLVKFVNNFLASIVPCVTRTGGYVDKFLTQNGVVVMALWGAADSAAGTANNAHNTVADAFNAIRSVLMMRNVLRKVNVKRFTSGGPLPMIKIGCGINSGEVIVGQMGSDERMEYTVIGDAVNLAARIEEPNEEFDTDILITENTRKLIDRYLISEEMPGLEVKGKKEKLRVFSVVNIRNCYGPTTLEEVRRLWRM